MSLSVWLVPASEVVLTSVSEVDELYEPEKTSALAVLVALSVVVVVLLSVRDWSVVVAVTVLVSLAVLVELVLPA